MSADAARPGCRWRWPRGQCTTSPTVSGSSSSPRSTTQTSSREPCWRRSAAASSLGGHRSRRSRVRSPDAPPCSSWTTASTSSRLRRTSRRSCLSGSPTLSILATSREQLGVAGEVTFTRSEPVDRHRSVGAVRRPSGQGPSRLRSDRRERRGDRRDLPAPRRHAARARARRRSDPLAQPPTDLRRAVGSVPAAVDGRPDVDAAPTDAARLGRLELRPAQPTTSGRRCAGCRSSRAASISMRRRPSSPTIEIDAHRRHGSRGFPCRQVARHRATTEVGFVRYRMLETIREYGAERLDEAGERARRRAPTPGALPHVAQHASAEEEGPNQAEWRARVMAEMDNVRAALQVCARRRLTAPP